MFYEESLIEALVDADIEAKITAEEEKAQGNCLQHNYFFVE